MTLYYSLLKAFLDGKLYNKYIEYIDDNHIKENFPELFKLYQCLNSLHREREEKTYTINDLEIALQTLYPNIVLENYQPILKQLQETTFDVSKIQEYLESIRSRESATRIAKQALSVSEGRSTWEDLLLLVEQQKPESLGLVTTNFEEDDLDVLKENQFSKQGLRWRLNSLNLTLGSLRKGDFGFLFARPETGKTTFLCDQVSFMAGQTDAPILWFNNEEQGGKVILRNYQAALGLSLTQLFSNTTTNKAKYQELTKGNIKLIADSSITKQRVETLCQQYQPSLIIFDQIDKIHGFAKDARDDIVLKNIYVWARELAKQYAPIIAVCQAGATGDGKRWLTMNDVDNSKTGKQGEADWILGIGKDYDEGHEGIRYLNISKNKLIGDTDTIANKRHDRWEVKIRPDIARYEDF